MTELLVDKIASQIGGIFVVSDGERLCALDYEDYETRMMKLLQLRYGHFNLQHMQNPKGLSHLIQAYLDGDVECVNAIQVNPGGTAFQKQVWAALRTIPAGTTVSYGDLAKKIGKPNAYRAVGMANSLNPIAIVIPCHRVVGANATLTGYAGGLERKRWLLQHEGVELALEFPNPFLAVR